MKRFTRHGTDGTWEAIPVYRSTVELLEERALLEMREKGYGAMYDQKAFTNIKKMLMNAYHKDIPINLVPYSKYLQKMRWR